MELFNIQKIKILVLLLFCIIFSCSTTSVFCDTKQELSQIKENIKKTKADLDISKQKEKKIKKEVDVISKNLQKTLKNIKSLEKSIDVSKKDYESEIHKLNDEKKREQLYRKMLKKELELLYKQKFINRNDFLLVLNSFFVEDNLTREMEFLYNIKTFLFYSHNKYNYSMAQQNLIIEAQHKIEKNINVLSQKKQTNKKTQEKLSGQKSEKENLIEEEHKKQKLYEQQINEMNQAAKKLENLLNSLTQNKRGNIGKYSEVITKFGYISKPCVGEISIRYGKNQHPKYNTFYVSNGIEIKNASSVAVKAVLPGKVVFCDKFSSYGNTVIIEHQDQIYTVYAYLNTISVTHGQVLTKNTSLGTTGFSAISNSNALYFEVRLNGIAMDPEVWIK